MVIVLVFAVTFSSVMFMILYVFFLFIYRYHMSQLRSLEKEVYLVQRQLDKDPANESKLKEKADLEKQV